MDIYLSALREGVRLLLGGDSEVLRIAWLSLRLSLLATLLLVGGAIIASLWTTRGKT